ncbi:MAG: efflux RND transporter periplasmic adaptor subunit, partial [Bryobacteraceae bacterium]
TTIRSPFRAHVKERLVNVGQYVKANTPVFTLVKIDPIRMKIEVPERMAPWIRTGQSAEVVVEAFQGKPFAGKIWRISPTVEQSKRTFIVEALIPNPDGMLKPGSYAKALIHTSKVDTIHLVPLRSVNYVFGTNKLYVVKDGVIEAREVKLGDRFGENVEIMEGVAAGDRVATTQTQRLDTGVKVQIADGAERK